MERRLPALSAAEGSRRPTRGSKCGRAFFEHRLSAAGYLPEAFHFVSTVIVERTRARQAGAVP